MREFAVVDLQCFRREDRLEILGPIGQGRQFEDEPLKVGVSYYSIAALISHRLSP